MVAYIDNEFARHTQCTNTKTGPSEENKRAILQSPKHYIKQKIIVAFPTIIVYKDFHNIHQQTAATLITV